MRYVVDASVGFMWEVPEPLSAKARALRDDHVNNIHELHTTDLFATEIGNAFLVAERRKRIKPGQGAIFLASVLKARPIIHPTLPDLLPRAYSIAASTVVSVYDALYVALAEREASQLVTADDKLVRNLQSQFPFILALSTIP